MKNKFLLVFLILNSLNLQILQSQTVISGVGSACSGTTTSYTITNAPIYEANTLPQNRLLLIGSNSYITEVTLQSGEKVYPYDYYYIYGAGELNRPIACKVAWGETSELTLVSLVITFNESGKKHVASKKISLFPLPSITVNTGSCNSFSCILSPANTFDFVTWELNSNIIGTNIPSNQPITVTGNGQLCATTSPGNCKTCTNLSSSYGISEGERFCSSYQCTENLSLVGNGGSASTPTSFSWSGLNLNTNNQSGFFFNNNNNGSTISVTFTNQGYFRFFCNIVVCGQTQTVASAPIYIYFYNNYNYYIVSPNPATNKVSISTKKKDISNNIEVGSNNDLIFETQLVDKIGRIRKIEKNIFGIENMSIDVDDLETDIYILRIFNGKIWNNEKIWVKPN